MTKLVKMQGGVTRPTRDAASVDAAIKHFREEGANVLVAASLVEEMPPDHRLVVRKLEFDRDRDFYPTKYARSKSDGQYAPSKRALEQVANALGVQWHAHLCERLEPFEPNVACFKAVAVAPDPATGEPRMFVGTYELDLRDGTSLHEEHLEKLGDAKREAARDSKNQWKVDNEIKAFRIRRRHVVALADTGARLRVIRQIAPLRSDYTWTEISQPFVTVSMVYQPGIDDPEARRAIAQAAATARMQLYFGAGIPATAPVSAEPLPALPPSPEPRALLEDDDDDLAAAFAEVDEPEDVEPVEESPEPAANSPEDIGYTKPKSPPPNVPTDAIVWCDAEGNVERFPQPSVLSGASRAARVYVTRAAIERSGYDYAAKMASANMAPATPVEALPDTWLAALYGQCQALIEAQIVEAHKPEEPDLGGADFSGFSDADIPFD